MLTCADAADVADVCRMLTYADASACVLQENVGRQGNYPHGIDIVTRADYYALGNRSNAFLTVAPYVGSFPDYQQGLARHLVARQLRHWDAAVRVLAGIMQ